MHGDSAPPWGEPERHRCAGAILTNLGRHQWGSGWAQALLGVLFFYLWKNPAQGAGTSITAAVSPNLEAHSGAHNAWTAVYATMAVKVLSAHIQGSVF